MAGGQKVTDPNSKPGDWSGAVTFPNGAVYFPAGDFFIMPNGERIQNDANAKAKIEANLRGRPRGQPGTVGVPSDPNQPTGPKRDDSNAPPTQDQTGQNPKGQPGPGGGDPGDPGPGGKGQPDLTPPASPNTPTPNTPFDPNADANFNKGQPRPDQMPGDVFSPFLENFYSQGGFNPYAGGGLADGYGAFGGGQGYGGSGWGRFIGSAQGYDPLGIGMDNYINEDASYYPMVGVNAVNGYDGMKPKYGVVGGQGGYGIGMVGPDYTGPIWDSVPDVAKLYDQRGYLYSPQMAQQAPWAEQAPAPPVDSSGGAGTTTEGTNVNQNPKGQPQQQQNTQQQSSAQQNRTWNPAWGSPTDSAGNVISAEQYWKNLDDWNKYHTIAAPSTFHTQYGDLVTSSTGNNNLYKVNGAADDQLFYYDPQRGWQRANNYQNWTDQQAFGLADPNKYGQAAGQVYNNMSTGAQTLNPNGQGSPFQMTSASSQYSGTPDPQASKWNSVKRDRRGYIIR